MQAPVSKSSADNWPEHQRYYLAQSLQIPERSQLVLPCQYRSKPASMLVVRLNGLIYGFLNRCVHMPFRLDCEQVSVIDPSANRIKCSMHGLVFDPLTGACQSPTMCTGEQLTAIALWEDSQPIWLEDKDVRLPN
ncbi:MAG TPA: Rieske 2Fe-2S domain-containing protein [Cellvibrionaceae bacterium]|nr:Rieske 2Fe-2S domain-containing protein [Cellvibrionaceae bacterium]